MDACQKIVAIDAKELSKEHIGSLGFVLLEVIPRLKKRYKLILFSDIAIPSVFLDKNITVVIRNEKYTGGSDLIRYDYWMKKKCEEYHADWYFQINHFSLFPMKLTKQIVVVHDLYPLDGIEQQPISLRLFYWGSLFFTMCNANHIFTVSQFTKRRLSHFFWKSKKVSVNYNGISTIQKSGILPLFDGKFFLMLGRVSYWKGTIRVAELFEKYFKNSDYKLIIAGQAQVKKDAMQMKAIVDRVSNIIWMDYVDNETRNWLLQHASLFLYASRYDGFGLPPLEAALVETPSLINDIPVLREVTQNAGNYVDFYGKDEKVYQAICNVIKKNNVLQVEKMKKIAQCYTWDKFTDQVVSIIDSN